MVERTKSKRRVALSVSLIALALGTGLAVGKFALAEKPIREVITKTETVTVEVPVYNLPEIDTSNVMYYDVPLTDNMQRYIYELSATESVPVPLILAIIEHESGFNPDAVSHTDDYGLMQINKINLGWLSEEYRCADITDPYQNVFCGVKIVGSFIEKYDGDIKKAMMAYHLGDYGAEKAWESGVTSTKAVDEILELMHSYED